ncbi:hypothetical protein BJY59DRAFT_695086 [Rhodotorula toruloides]
MFITSKLWNSQHRRDLVEPALDDTLKELDLSYLDFYLIHPPLPSPKCPKLQQTFVPTSLLRGATLGRVWET